MGCVVLTYHALQHRRDAAHMCYSIDVVEAASNVLKQALSMPAGQLFCATYRQRATEGGNNLLHFLHPFLPHAPSKKKVILIA